MMHSLKESLTAHLKSRGCPIPVFEREHAGRATWDRESIVIEHDDGDAFGPPHSNRRNAAHRFTRSVAAKITIFAQSTRPGALEFEHRDRAEHALDLVLCALYEILKTNRNGWAPSSGGFLQPEDLDRSTHRGGAAYQLLFSYDRAVIDETWKYESKPETAIGPGGTTIKSKTEASLYGGPDGEVPETGCGA